jgi:hypothetical protein
MNERAKTSGLEHDDFMSSDCDNLEADSSLISGKDSRGKDAYEHDNNDIVRYNEEQGFASLINDNLVRNCMRVKTSLARYCAWESESDNRQTTNATNGITDNRKASCALNCIKVLEGYE